MRKTQKKQQEFDYLLKTIIIGDSGVGKSNILLRYSQNKFADNYVMTIGINFMYKLVQIDDVKIKLQIWDTAGQDKYKTITQSYYNGSNGVIVAYSVQNKQSFNSVKNWIMDLKEKVNNNCQIILIGNKCDLEQREISLEQGQNLAKQYNIPFFECSAKAGINIEECFRKLAELMKQNIIDSKTQLEDSTAVEETKNIINEKLKLEIKKNNSKRSDCIC